PIVQEPAGAAPASPPKPSAGADGENVMGTLVGGGSAPESYGMNGLGLRGAGKGGGGAAGASTGLGALGLVGKDGYRGPAQKTEKAQGAAYYAHGEEQRMAEPKASHAARMSSTRTAAANQGLLGSLRNGDGVADLSEVLANKPDDENSATVGFDEED